jgi:hypothetical protein
VACEGEVLRGVDGAEVEGHGLGVVSPVYDGEDFARRGQVAEPDVVFFFGVAADGLGLLGQQILVECDYIFVRQDVLRCLREAIGVEGRADGER